MRRKELRNIKENLWKKWRTSREKERKRDKEETEIDRSKTLEGNLEKLVRLVIPLQAKAELNSSPGNIVVSRAWRGISTKMRMIRWAELNNNTPRIELN